MPRTIVCSLNRGMLSKYFKINLISNLHVVELGEKNSISSFDSSLGFLGHEEVKLLRIT